MSEFPAWLKQLWPAPVNGALRDHARASLGAGLGILGTGMLAQHFLATEVATTVFLIAPMGASAVILFCLPSSPLAQPWAMLMGNLVAAFCGVLCSQLLPQHIAMAAALAMLSSIAGMFALRCLHPPSGAVALTAVLGGPAIHALGFHFVWWPVLGSSLLLVTAACIYHRLTGHLYPAVRAESAPEAPAHLHYQFGFKREDLQAALQQFHEVLDISPDNLQSLLQETELIAYRRKLEAIECQQIMRPVTTTLEYGDSLEDAWRLMLQQSEPAIAVVNKARLVIGLLHQADFIRHAQPESFAQVAPRFKRLIKRSPTTHSSKPEVVGQIMSTPVITVPAHAHLVHMVPLMTTHDLQMVPVINAQNQLVGMLSQTDVIRALYR